MSGKAIGNTYSARMQYFKVMHFCVFADLFFPSVCCLSIRFLIKIKEVKRKSWPGGQKPSFYGEQMGKVNYPSRLGKRVRNFRK